MALGLGAFAPGVALLAAGIWVHGQGGGRAVLVAGVVALGLGLFVLLAIGSVLRRSAPDGVERPPRAPGA